MTREEFWRDQHLANDKFWLTGSTMLDLLDAYDLPLPVRFRVTDIGVGLGIATRELAENNLVTAVDIELGALTRVRAWVDDCQLTGSVALARPADLVFCHFVFQHCADTEVARILRETPVKRGGVFAFNTAFLLEEDDGSWDPIRIVWRPRKEILRLAADAGLVPFWERTSETSFDGARVGVSYFKCKKE